MPEPADDGYKVEPAKLRKEGERWAQQSPKMGQISTEGHFLRFNGDEAGLLGFMFAPSYHKVVTMITERCSEAEDRMMDIKHRLDQIAAGYEEREERTAQAFRKAAEALR